MTIHGILRSNPSGVVARAYHFAERAHAGQRRNTGEPYFVHPEKTAEILLLWNLDESTIVAGLLHDTLEDTATKIEDIRKEFGEEVAFIVEGVTKLGHIKYRGAEARIENMRKLILALSEDLRVVFVKLADRLHNMQTLAVLPPQKQKRIALETAEIYAPLAYRLGMHLVSGELEDLAFPYLYPQEHRWLRETAIEHYEKRHAYLETLVPRLREEFDAHHIQPTAIDFRAKRVSSLYKKLLRHDMDIEKIYDLVALRIIVHTIEECYGVLGVVHQLWPPLPGRIKDYIAMPKPNRYRSIHTTVIGPEGKPVEIQIRTREMHEENEHGLAAHWMYKQKGLPNSATKNLAQEAAVVRELRAWQDYTSSSEINQEQFLRAMKIDLFKDRIFAITPHGDVIDLPVESTPVDFAYNIHTEVGNTAVGAKVNGHITPLNHKLRSGDMVEILTQKHKKPSEDWLLFVVTVIAKHHIKAALRLSHHGLRSIVPTKTELRVVVEDRIGLIKDISSVIARSHINILNFQIHNPAGSRFPVNRIECAITDRAKIEKLLLKLKQIKEVREVSYKIM